MSNRFRDYRFWAAIAILVSMIVLMFAVGSKLLVLRFEVAGESFHHLLTWIGTVFIAIYTPIYFSAKRRYPRKIRALLGFHMFGNLLAVLFVSLHFTHQITRSPQAYPDLSTGIILFPTVLLIAFSGMFIRFQIGPRLRGLWRFLHQGGTLSLYLIIVVHILHGLEIF